MHYNAGVFDPAALRPTTRSASAALLARIEQAQQRHALFPRAPAAHQPVVVAVSGGMDSTVLLHILMQIAPEWQLDLHVAHIDHALRPTSAADALFVHDLAAHTQTPFHLARLAGADLLRDPAGVEAAARRARYRALCVIACNVTPAAQVPVIAVAHHAQDQAETLLLRLVQGSGLAGLAAMRPVTVIDDAALTSRPVRVVRPLLELDRDELQAYAHDHHLAWREDESNADTARSRNLLRHAVLPQLAQINPQVVATLARTAELLADDADRLDALDRQLLHGLTVAADDERVLRDLAGVQRLPAAEVRGVLRAALRQLGADLRELGAAPLAALAAALLQARASSGPHPLASRLAWSVVWVEQAMRLSLHHQNALPILPGGPWLDEGWRQRSGSAPVNGVVAVGRWRLTSQQITRSALSSDWRHNAECWTAYFDADAVSAPLLTTPQPGDRIALLGLAGKRKLAGDLFTDAKIAPALRPGWPVIVDAASGELLWVCGLAQAHAARITAQTRRVLVLTWAPLPNPDREGGAPLPHGRGSAGRGSAGQGSAGATPPAQHGGQPCAST